MKKVLEDELMSLAHRILKLRNRADIHQLKEEAAIFHKRLTGIIFFLQFICEELFTLKHFFRLKKVMKTANR